MRKVAIRVLRADLSGQLGDLPFVITKNGEDIAMCTQIVDESDMKSVHKCECVHNECEPIDAPSKSVQRRLAVQKEAQWNKSSDKHVIPQDWRDEVKPIPKKGKKK